MTSQENKPADQQNQVITFLYENTITFFFHFMIGGCQTTP